MTTLGVTLNGGGEQTVRRTNDFYATPPGTTRALLPYIRGVFPKKLWECACGERHLSVELEAEGYRVVESDLADRGVGAITKDFLRFTHPLANAIVTNPPFSMADHFIEHALVFLGVDHLALLLPAGFWHAQGRIEMFHRLKPSLILPCTWRIDSTGGGSPTMNIQWVVWSTNLPPIAGFEPMQALDPYPGRFIIDPLT
jgi:hypothetical protein